jgi:hypothetical protein
VSAKRKSGKKQNCKHGETVKDDWKKVALSLNLPGYGAEQCQERYEFLKTIEIGKGPWQAHEDAQILSMVLASGRLTCYTPLLKI